MSKHTRAYWKKRITIGNIKNGDTGEYIGRKAPRYEESPLSNPYPVKRFGREVAIESYRGYLKLCLGSPDSRQSYEIARLAGLLAIASGAKPIRGHLTLLCWCVPLACHGEVVKEAILDYIGRVDLES